MESCNNSTRFTFAEAKVQHVSNLILMEQKECQIFFVYRTQWALINAPKLWNNDPTPYGSYTLIELMVQFTSMRKRHQERSSHRMSIARSLVAISMSLGWLLAVDRLCVILNCQALRYVSQRFQVALDQCLHKVAGFILCVPIRHIHHKRLDHQSSRSPVYSFRMCSNDRWVVLQYKRKYMRENSVKGVFDSSIDNKCKPKFQ